MQNINKITPQKGINLRTCDPEELVGFRKISVFIPKPLMIIQEFLKNIKRQNY